MKTLRLPHSTSRSRPAFYLLASVLWLSPFFIGHAAAQTPLLPSVVGTYYYEGYDEANSRYVYLADTGTFYYVDSNGITSVGAAAGRTTTDSPYRAVIAAGGTTSFQFFNASTGLYTTATDDNGSPYTSYAVRGGTWYANDITFTLTSLNTASQNSAILMLGYTGSGATAQSHPVSFVGANVTSIVTGVGSGTARHALSLRNGATAYIFGGVLSKTATDNGISETVYLVGNQEGYGSSSYLYGENLNILASGTSVSAITMLAGNNSVDLLNSTITINNGLAVNSARSAINIGDTELQGGAHFYGENLLITNASGRLVGMAVAGANTFTLVSSTMIQNGNAAAIGFLATSASTGDRFVSSVTLRDTTVLTTGSYAPIMQQIGNRATTTIANCTLTTTGANSVGIRLIAANDNTDSTRNTIRITDSSLITERASAIDVNIEAGPAGNWGQAGGGAKQAPTKIESVFDIIIRSSTISGYGAFLRVTTAGSGTAPYLNYTQVFAYDSVLRGGILMPAGQAANYTGGGNLTFTASNSIIDGGLSISGSTPFRLGHQAIFYVYDSTWTGDISLTNRGNLTLQFKDTPIQGNLSMSGSTQVQLRLANSTISGSITVADTAVLTGEVLGAGQVDAFAASGGTTKLTLDHVPATSITANGTADVRLIVGGDVVVASGLQVGGNATLGITLRDNNSFTGDVTIVDRATFVLDSAKPGAVSLNGDIANSGIWHIPSKTVLNGNFAFTNYLGTISIINASPDNLVLSNGLTGNGRLDVISIDGNVAANTEFRVIHDPTGTFISATSAPLLLSHPVDYGLASYHLDNRPDGAYLVGGLDSGSFGTGGAAVFNSRALAAEDWFAALVPLDQRLGLMRQDNAGILSGASDSARAQGDSGSFWLQARTASTRVDRGSRSLNFTSRTIGFTAGGDARWDSDTASFTVGLFVDSARVDNKFTGAAKGSITSAAGGIYATYQHRKGGYVSAIGRFDVNKNTLDTHNPNNALAANYQTQAAGGALELGWHFALNSGWWLEPAYQFGAVSLPGVDYKTESSRLGNVIDISIADASALQHYVRFAFGKALDSNWRLRGHLAFASVRASGGNFNASGLNDANFNIDGNRGEVAFGVARFISRSSRLSLDVAYTHASDYKRPFTITFGWGMAW